MRCAVLNCKSGRKGSSKFKFYRFPHPIREPFRFAEWRNATKNPRIVNQSEFSIFSHNFICQRHFERNCFNEFNKILKTAVPTLNLNNKRKRRYSDDKLEVFDPMDYNTEIFLSPENEFDHPYFIEVYSRDESCNQHDYGPFQEVPIDLDSVQKWESQFFESPKNVVAQNACSKIDPFDVCMSRKKLQTTNHVFEFKVDNEGKPMTDQKNSGRCWIFAALNCLRIPFMKSLNVEEFEFSQSYLFYWDKIERSNYFLHNIVQTANRGEKLDGRLVNFLLSDPIPDGGQWDMFVNLVKKHGLVPKKLFPESFCSGKTIRLNTILKSKLREFGRDLRAMVEEKRSSTELQNKINEQMQQIYKIVGICLGIPPSSFTWEYQDKSKCYKAIGPVTPLEFYENHVRPIFDVNVKVCLVTDPRPENPYQKSYTIDCLGNVVGGRKIFYNNQPVELMMDLVMQSIKSGEPVWFGCDVTKRFAMKPGIEDLELHDFKTVFDCDIQISLNKAERLKFGESAMTHAMLFTGVSTEGGKPTKFRVENSWGEDSGEKGYLVMSAQWFKEFVYEIVVDQKFVPDNVMDIFALDPVVLPAWDPMGTLAQ